MIIVMFIKIMDLAKITKNVAYSSLSFSQGDVIFKGKIVTLQKLHIWHQQQKMEQNTQLQQIAVAAGFGFPPQIISPV